MRNALYIDYYESPIGIIEIKTDVDNLISLGFIEQRGPDSPNDLLIEIKSQLKEYFERLRKTFDIPYIVKGTMFQETIWKECAKIPYGHTLTYKELALRGNFPKASRAVGQVMAKNPIPIIIPCHRIISSSGKTGGYSGGIWRKKYLLGLE